MKHSYECSDPYGEQLIAMVVKKGNTEISSFEDLEGKVSANSLSSSSGKIAKSYGAELVEGFSGAGHAADRAGSC